MSAHVTFKSQWLRESHSLPCMFGQLPLPGGHQNRTPLVLKKSHVFVPHSWIQSQSQPRNPPNPVASKLWFRSKKEYMSKTLLHLTTWTPKQSTSNILPYSPPAILMGSLGAGNPPNFALCSCCACCAWEVRPAKKKSGGRMQMFSFPGFCWLGISKYHWCFLVESSKKNWHLLPCHKIHMNAFSRPYKYRNHRTVHLRKTSPLRSKPS